MAMARIYLDHSATTPLAPEVEHAMLGALRLCGNPSSLHEEGRRARQAVERARAQVAALIGAAPADVCFTSGGTESNSTALLGLGELAQQQGRPLHIVTSPLEHPSVQKPLRRLEARGFVVTELPVDAQGRIDPGALARVLDERPASVVALALVNHELGNVYPIAQLAALAHARGAWVHCDAVQAAGKLPIDVRGLGVDTLSLSAHKVYGPKGTGVLYVAGPAQVAGGCGLSLSLPSLLAGGEQERGRRAGTENVAGIVGLGACADLARQTLLPAVQELAARRDRLEAGLLSIGGVSANGDRAQRSPSVCNLRFADVDGELLLSSLDLDGIAVSTGAACSSGSSEPSQVLRALGQSRSQAKEALRFSLGRGTTDADIEQTIATVAQVVARIRALGPAPILTAASAA